MDQTLIDILNLLYPLGISANYTGCLQTAYAVELCLAEPVRLLMVTKSIYPEVARLCGTSWMAVERNIRTVCGIAWKNNRQLLEHLARRPFPRKPCNTQFLAILLYCLQRCCQVPAEAEPIDRPSFW